MAERILEGYQPLENYRSLEANVADAAVLASIAISLKRIADVLDGTAVGICVTETIFNPQTVQNREVRNNY